MHEHASVHENEKSATVGHVLVCVQMYAHTHVVCTPEGVHVCACCMCFCVFVSKSAQPLSPSRVHRCAG